MTPFTADVKKVGSILVLDMNDREAIARFVNETFKEGDIAWITISKPTKERTHKQHKYLYVWYTAIAKALGCREKEADGVMRKKFLTVNEDSRLEYVRSLSDLTRKELVEYTEDVSQYAKAMGIEIETRETGEKDEG